jgi:hypothetical protein
METQNTLSALLWRLDLSSVNELVIKFFMFFPAILDPRPWKYLNNPNPEV